LRSLPGRQVDEEQLLAPIPLLRHATAGWGLLVLSPIDPDLGVRRIFTGVDSVPSVTWKMARYLGAPLPETPDSVQGRWLNYYGPAGLMESVGYNEALQGNELPLNFFQGKIVIVGGRQTIGNLDQQKDQFFSPYTRWGQPFAAGMEIHATTLLNLIHHDWLERSNPGTEVWLNILYGVFITLLLTFVCAFGPFRAAGVAVASALLVAVAACWSAWHDHVWFDWLVPATIQTPAALFWAVGSNYLIEARRRLAIRRAFSLYLSPHMADEIAEARFDLKPGGKLTEATMMFTDLKGFTTLSEQINDPLQIAEVMITYFNNTTKHVLDNRGTIIKYMGDAVFASWGAPLKDEDHAYHAVVAAWGMHQSSQLNVRGHHLVTRIGVNTGTVVSGNLGSDFRFDYALIGDPVNLASRLEGLNKYLGTQVLLADATWQRLRGRFAGRILGRFVLLGKTEPVTIHELLGPNVTNAIQAQIESFNEALKCFQEGDLAKARTCFDRTLAKCGGSDGPCEYYLREIASLEKNGLPPDWNGAIVLESK
jgi:adenylate cyclase